MYRSLALCALFAVTACSGVNMDAVNPMNWFDRGSSEQTAAPEPLEVVDAREFVPQVIEASPQPISNGIILLAKGVTPTSGYWDPALVPTNNEQPVDGILTYEFRVASPALADGETTAESTELQAARTITGDKLEGVSTIRVVSATNYMEVPLTL